MRKVIELGRQARSAAKLPLRQPLRHARRRRAEPLAVPRRRDRRGATGEAGGLRTDRSDRDQGPSEPEDARPAPRCATSTRSARPSPPATSRCARRRLPRRRCHDLPPTTCSSSAREKAGWAVASSDDNAITVAFDTTFDRRPAPRGPRLRPHPHRQRPAQGLRLEHRRPHRPDAGATDADLLAFADWIKAQTLAVTIDAKGAELAVSRLRTGPPARPDINLDRALPPMIVLQLCMNACWRRCRGRRRVARGAEDGGGTPLT